MSGQTLCMIIAGNWKLMATSQSGEEVPYWPWPGSSPQRSEREAPQKWVLRSGFKVPGYTSLVYPGVFVSSNGVGWLEGCETRRICSAQTTAGDYGVVEMGEGPGLLVGGSNEGLHHRMYVCSLRESTLDSAWRWGKQALIERSPWQCGGLRSGCVGEHSYGWGPCQGTRPGQRAPAPAPCTACKVQFESLSGGRMWWRTGSLSRLAESCLWPSFFGCEAWKSWLGSRSVLDLSCRGDWSHLPPGRNTIATGRSVIEGRQSIQCSWTQVLQAGIRHPINACGRGASGFGNCTPDQLRREKAKVWFYVDQVNGSVDYSIFGTMHLCVDGGIG